jgi:hypothetical protein
MMSAESLSNIVEVIRVCFQTRDFDPMVNLFADDGIYETPYAFENSKAIGIEAIRKRFALVADSAWNKAVKIDTVTVKTMPMTDGDAVFAPFSISGYRVSDNTLFNFPSSVAVIHVHNNRISYYQDYPNVLGIRKAAGLA